MEEVEFQECKTDWADHQATGIMSELGAISPTQKIKAINEVVFSLENLKKGIING